MSSLMNLYTRSFEKRPYVTLLLCNSILMGLGDFSAQALQAWTTGVPLSYDTMRTFRYAFYGASVGPLGGAWNKYLELNFPLRRVALSTYEPFPMTNLQNPIPGLKIPKGAKLERGDQYADKEKFNGKERKPPSPVNDVQPISYLALAKRLLADQFGMAPASLFLFLFSMGVMEGLEYEELVYKIKHYFFPILVANWKIWPVLQFVNFRYVPLRFRVPFGSVCGIAWTCYLSTKTG